MVSAQIFLAQVVFVSTLGSKEGGAEATRDRGTNLAQFGAVALLPIWLQRPVSQLEEGGGRFLVDQALPAVGGIRRSDA